MLKWLLSLTQRKATRIVSPICSPRIFKSSQYFSRNFAWNYVNLSKNAGKIEMKAPTHPIKIDSLFFDRMTMWAPCQVHTWNCRNQWGDSIQVKCVMVGIGRHEDHHTNNLCLWYKQKLFSLSIFAVGIQYTTISQSHTSIHTMYNDDLVWALFNVHSLWLAVQWDECRWCEWSF